ncbi:MAG: HAD family hydrolase [Alphaproteobacteria bacterium]
MSAIRRVAMWSGPRNLSSAMMRSFGNRADAWVVDEPLYACFLERTGKDHPLRAESLASQPRDWRAVAERLTTERCHGRTLFYQKHMTHHLVAGIGRDWIDLLENAFLIRDPRAVIASYVKSREAVAMDDLGYDVQAALFERERARTGRVPPVVDAADVLADPRRVLSALCAALGVPFDPAMLAWTPGPRPTDGVWGAHWYRSLWASTGFAPARAEAVELPAALAPLAAACEPHYRMLHAHRITG